MAWILLLLAVACFLVPYFTTSFALGALCLLLALVLLLVAMMKMLAGRLQGASRSDVEILSPSELHALREQAKALRQSPEESTSSGASGDTPSARPE